MNDALDAALPSTDRQRSWRDLTPAEQNAFIWKASGGLAGVDPSPSTSPGEHS